MLHVVHPPRSSRLILDTDDIEMHWVTSLVDLAFCWAISLSET